MNTSGSVLRFLLIRASSALSAALRASQSGINMLRARLRRIQEQSSSVTVQRRKRSSALLWQCEKSQSKLIWKEVKQTQTHPNPLQPAARHKSAKGSGKCGRDSHHTPKLFCYLSLSVIGLLFNKASLCLLTCDRAS